MSILKGKPRHEVISVRLNEDRLRLLERFQKVHGQRLGKELSLGEAAFLALEDRADIVDRETARMEMLSSPTASLAAIRKKWESQHSLSIAEWDVLAHYLQAGAEEEAQEPPLLWPAIPSRQSYLALLGAFEAVYQCAKKGSKHDWLYLGSLGGNSTGATSSDRDTEQRYQAVLKQIANRRELLASADKWQSPGAVAKCLVVAIRYEAIEGTSLDQVLAPFWPTLWGLAARGHWVRHNRQPVRPSGPFDDDIRGRIILPGPFKTGELKLSFAGAGLPELGMTIDLGPTRRVSFTIARYPELAEFRAMVEGWPMKRSWNGRHFLATPSKEKSETTTTLWLRRNDVGIEFTAEEWEGLRELAGKASASPEIQRWLAELRQEYGEHG